MAEPGNCPACGAVETTSAFAASDIRYGTPGEFTIIRCGNCGTGRTSPSLEDVSAWYPSSYQNFLARDSATDRIFVRSAARYVGSGTGTRRALSALVPATDLGGPVTKATRVLDVGAGSGHMVGALRQRGVDAWGVEPSSDAVRRAHARGVPTIEVGTLSVFADRHPDARWDVIRFWHTLEHMREPRVDLDVAHGLLAPGGRVVVGVPNFGGVLSRATRQDWGHLDAPRHYTHFTATGVRAVLRRSGFHVSRVRTVAVMGGLPATIMYRLRREAKPSMAMMLLAHPAEVLLAALGNGDGLLAVASRVDRGATDA